MNENLPEFVINNRIQAANMAEASQILSCINGMIVQPDGNLAIILVFLSVRITFDKFQEDFDFEIFPVVLWLRYHNQILNLDIPVVKSAICLIHAFRIVLIILHLFNFNITVFAYRFNFPIKSNPFTDSKFHLIYFRLKLPVSKCLFLSFQIPPES